MLVLGAESMGIGQTSRAKIILTHFLWCWSALYQCVSTSHSFWSTSLKVAGSILPQSYLSLRVLERYEKGIAVVGSSNLTLSGVSHNTELNVVVQGNDNHTVLVNWFDELWGESQDFDETLMHEMQQSWAVVPTRPYDIYWQRA
jgi:phosphatidylserine/phosphatidylglycerophosphate/cardiolipin synthase-like enzyme